MKIKQLAMLIMLMALSFVLNGCGGGGGGGGGDITVSASKASVLADGNDSATITAVLKSPVPDGTAVQFTVTSGTATLSSITATTGNTATAKVTSTSVGKVTVTASFSGFSGSSDVDFVAAPVTGITVSASKASVLADGNDSATITAVLKSPVPDGTAVQFAVTSGTATLNSITTTTGNTATAKVTSTTVGKVTVAVSFSGSSGSTTLDLVAVPAITVTPSKGTARADGQDSTTIAATFASTVPDGTPVAFAITSGPGTLSSATSNTVANKASVTLKSTSFGQTTVQASYVGSSGTTTVNFPQPLSADVAVALNMSVKQVTFLSFKLINNPASSVAITQSNVTLASDIAGSTQLALFDYTDPIATLTLNRPTTTSTGFDVVANKPFIQLLYTVQPGFMPLFSVSLNGITEPAGTFNSVNPSSSIPLPLTTSDFVVTVVYRDVHGNSF